MITFLINILLVFIIAINYYIFLLFGSIFGIKSFSLIYKLVNFNIYFMSPLSIFSNIRVNKIDMKNKNFLINCNHIDSVDDILVLVILNKLISNFDYKNIKSISNLSSRLEEDVFNMMDSIIINQETSIKELDNRIDNLTTKYKNISLIFFFEGIKSSNYNNFMEKKTNIKLKNVSFPKTPLFDLICQKNYFDYLIDINVIYHNKGNIIKGDNYFMDYLDPNVKAEVEIKIYNLPKENYEDWLLKLHQNKDLCLETIKKDIINNNK